MRDYKQSLEFKEIYMYTFRENGHLKTWRYQSADN